MNIKRSFLIICLLLVIIIAVTGCRSTKPDLDLKEEKIHFWVSVYHNEYDDLFLASAGIYQELSPNNLIYFDDAEIRVNDIELSGLEPDEDVNMYLYTARLDGLRAGDRITIKFSHSKVGNLEKEMDIPLPVTWLRLEPDDLEGWLHEGKSVTLYWDDIGADWNKILVELYSVNKRIISTHGLSRPSGETCYDLNEAREWFLEKYEEGCYATISVVPENVYLFSNGLFVASSYSETVITNRSDPGEESDSTKVQKTFPLLPPFAPSFDTWVYRGF